MTIPSLIAEPRRIDEPQASMDYANALTQVADEHKPLIVRRNGGDLAAIVPLEYLELLREIAGRQDVEKIAAETHWDQLSKTHVPPQHWFDDTDNPFVPEEPIR
jgi:PHD/YefM family antitoxin component YafN of YafNO toxin-antitoxin module